MSFAFIAVEKAAFVEGLAPESLWIGILRDEVQNFYAVQKAHEALKPDGSLVDPKQQAGIEGLGHTLAAFLMKLKG